MLQNYNKILTKCTVFSGYKNKTQIKTSTKKSAYFTHPDFSAAKIEKKKVRKLREQIRYIVFVLKTDVHVQEQRERALQIFH